MGRGPIHDKPHPYKGERVGVDGHGSAKTYTVMDWFDRYTGQAWQELRGNNRIATGYENRRKLKPYLPKGDDVVVVADPDGRTFACHDSEVEP
jgi:hypothetical protein